MSHLPIGFQLLLLAFVIAYAMFLVKSKLKPKVVRRAALVVLLAGVAVNMYGLYLEKFSESPTTLFFRALILSARMFVYDGDLIDMLTAQHSPLFLDFYFFVFYAAMLTSLSAILMLFGKRITTLLSLSFRKRKFRHVFIGLNHRSEIIAGGIDSNEEIAFIEFPADSDDGDISISQIFRGVTREENCFSLEKKDNVTVLCAKRKLRLSDRQKNVFATIGLEKLKKLTDADTVFYILSEDKKRNLDELMTLLSDEDLTGNTIHVCLSREGVARYYKTTLKRTGAHFIYPSSLAVVELMKTPSCHPAFVMKPELDGDGQPTGAVRGGFNALVVGFGETGQAVTKFLYEFSAAVNSDGMPAPARIIVNDDRIERLKGPFIFDNPEMGNSDILSYENLGTESSEFWSRLVNRLDQLNYIAISMKDDASNLDLACTIFMYAMKKRRGGLDDFRIIVRKRNTLSHERKLIEKMNERAGHEVMICYGEHEKVFTPEMIISKNRSGINRKATGLADRIADAYRSVSGREVNVRTKDESFHTKNRARMEMHQLISRANHVASISLFTNGMHEVSPEALENLAHAEHLRYSRYLTAHGYSSAAEDDDVFKTSHQICSWNELSEEDRQYHRDMVKAQLLTMADGPSE
ncbi:MAG: hypothetical protein MJY65_00805 [Bacteroidaceae bacterium]|nr:hypothetical protein [Bacteroidaceae bacterium]